MKTRQEIFDFAVVHMDNQRVGSFISETNDTCAYRGKDGKMCIVGAMIKDEFYSSFFEGVGVNNSAVITALLKSGVETLNNRTFFAQLQEIHDSYAKRDPGDYENLKEKFKLLGEQYMLDISILNGKFE